MRIFLSILRKKLSITLNDFTFGKNDGSYFKIKVTDETCFKENIKPNLILKEGKVTPKENVMYTCRILFQIQSVFFEIKDKKDDIIYYPQLLLDQCAYNCFINKVIFHSDLEFTDNEPESE